MIVTLQEDDPADLKVLGLEMKEKPYFKSVCMGLLKIALTLIIQAIGKGYFHALINKSKK